MATHRNSTYVVGVAWRLGRPLEAQQLDQLVDALDKWAPCIQPAATEVYVTIDVMAPDPHCAARSGRTLVSAALSAVAAGGEAESINVSTDDATWVYAGAEL